MYVILNESNTVKPVYKDQGNQISGFSEFSTGCVGGYFFLPLQENFIKCLEWQFMAIILLFSNKWWQFFAVGMWYMPLVISWHT